MTWYANQIYGRPLPEVVTALSRQPLLKRRMFLIDDLDGICFAWTRERFFSSDPTLNRREIKHGLPPGGLLAVYPVLSENGYTRRNPPRLEFYDYFFDDERSPPAAKWAAIRTSVDVPILLPAGWDVASFPMGLLRFLKSVSVETDSPLVWYWCAMWGGSIEQEAGWAFDRVDHVYYWADDEAAIDLTSEGQRIVRDRTTLQLLMSHVGLDLPTHFFALHTSFDWARYWLH